MGNETGIRADAEDECAELRCALEDEVTDLVAAAAANVSFWNNPWDDEDWNNA